jgi:hypothetical protein
MCGYKVESTTSTTWPTTLVRDLAVHFSTLRCTGTSSPSQSLDIEFNYKQEKKGLIFWRDDDENLVLFLKDLLADGLGHPGWAKGIEREAMTKAHKQETLLIDSPLLLLLLLLLFSRLFVNWSDVSCCVAADDAVALSRRPRYRTGQGKVRFRHDILSFIIDSAPSYTVVAGLANFYQSPSAYPSSLEKIHISH